MDPWSEAKRYIGRFAAERAPLTGVLGVGSGTTVDAFVDAVGERAHRERVKLTAVVASLMSAQRCQEVGIQVVPLETVDHLDLVVDGADAVDEAGSLIKGGGAALVRERLIMRSARQAWVLVDQSKVVPQFHDVVVPLAVIPYGWRQTMSRLERIGVSRLRTDDGRPILTDDGLYIVDLRVPVIDDPHAWHRHLKMEDGVVDTGLFAGYPVTTWVSDGQRVWSGPGLDNVSR